MAELIQILISGLSAGSIYALAAVGFTLLWQASQTINFAQGEFIMLPAFFVLALSVNMGLPLPLAIIFAIFLSAMALVALLSSVFVKATGALTESYATIPVDFGSSKLNQEDPTDGNYSGLVKDTMKEVFPFVKSRGDRRQLYARISAGASCELQDAAEANPALLGAVTPMPLLFSDDIIRSYFNISSWHICSQLPASQKTL